jgi:predicted DNA-binding transcriptional regulator AlpA
MERTYRMGKKREVRRVTGLSDWGIEQAIQTKAFPRPVRLLDQAWSWNMEEVYQWLDSAIAAARQDPQPKLVRKAGPGRGHKKEPASTTRSRKPISKRTRNEVAAA